jgi:tetratricopeptide (TPR) repeat protein
MDQQIIDYIIKEKGKGFSNEQIKNILIKTGHNIEKIDEHLLFHENTNNNSNRGKIESEIEEPEIKNSKKIELKYVLVSIFIFVILIISIGYHFMKEYSTELLIEDGWKLYNNKNYENSILKFEKVIKKDPNNYIGYGGLGANYFRLESFEKAINNFEKSIELNLNNSNSYMGLGWSFYYLENYEKAIENFEKGYKLNSSDIKIIEGLGMSYFEMGEYEKAELEFLKIMKINPLNDITYATIGTIYIEKIRHNKTNNSKLDLENAKKNLDKALQINFENYLAHRILGIYYIQTHEFKKAELEFLKAIEINSEDSFSFIELGWEIYFKEKNNINKSIIYLKKAEELNPINERNNLRLGWLYYLNKDYNKAILYYNETLKNNSLDGNTYIIIGFCYLEINKIENAKMFINKGQHINGINHFLSSLGSAKISRSEKKIDNALKEYNTSLILINQIPETKAIQTWTNIIQMEYDELVNNNKI